MHRTLLFGLATALLVAIPVTHTALADGSTTAICHVNSSNVGVNALGHSFSFGNTIEVSDDAVDSHLAHGDATFTSHEVEGFPLSAGHVAFFEDMGATIRNADCGIAIHD